MMFPKRNFSTPAGTDHRVAEAPMRLTSAAIGANIVQLDYGVRLDLLLMNTHSHLAERF